MVAETELCSILHYSLRPGDAIFAVIKCVRDSELSGFSVFLENDNRKQHKIFFKV